MSYKIAINCDWLTVRGGAEKVIIDLAKIFPNAHIYTSIYDEKFFPELSGRKVFTSYLQKIPKVFRKHTLLLPFYPKAFENFDFSSYDIVISSAHSLSKGIITGTNTFHICYCHTPVRALWSDNLMYKVDPRYKFIPNFLIEGMLHKLRIFDYLAAQRVDYFIANSNYVAERIEKFYRKKAKVIYPACDIQVSKSYKKQKGEYYLSISRFVPMKKNDLLIEAFNKMPDKKLRLYGNGSEYNRLKSMIKGDNIEIIEWQVNIFGKEREDIMSKAIAFLHPQLEDFGISPLDAQSYGVPVIALGEGGALETIVEGKTGIFHKTQNIDEICEIITKFKEDDYKYEDMLFNVNKFSFDIFKNNIDKLCELGNNRI